MITHSKKLKSGISLFTYQMGPFLESLEEIRLRQLLRPLPLLQLLQLPRVAEKRKRWK